MEYTLDEVIAQEIESYRPIDKNDTGFYAVRYSVDENDIADEFGQIMIYSSPFDEDPVIVEDKKDIPQDGWMHNDNCQCDDCSLSLTINYDSNRKVVDEDSPAIWSTTTYYLNDLDEIESNQLCADINYDKLEVLGEVNTENDIKRLLKKVLEDEEDDVNREADSIEFTGPGIYILSAYRTLNEIHIARAKETFLNEIKNMPDEDKEMYKLSK